MTLSSRSTTEDAVPALRLSGSEVDDTVLVRQLQDGDPRAAEQLVERYVRPLGGYLRRLSGSDAVAEELFQQTWLSVLEHINRFDPNAEHANFKAWLFRIASNKAFDRHRRTKRDRKAFDTLRLTHAEASTAEAEGGLVRGEDAVRVRAAVEQLPEAQRQVVLLRYYGGLKFVEIAEMLGCPLNTALGRMHKAIKKLRSTLDEGTDS